MSYEEKKLLCKIHYLEDKLLMCKNYSQIEELRSDLMILRKQLQSLKWRESK